MLLMVIKSTQLSLLQQAVATLTTTTSTLVMSPFQIFIMTGKGPGNWDHCEMITQMELLDPFSVAGVLDTAAWARTGTTGPTVGESLQQAGHKLRRADKNRIQGKIQIHEYLKLKQSGRPQIQIFNTCPNLIRELQSIPLDKNNPEDVDTHAPDHAYDALRYLIMSRPKINDPLSQMRYLRMEQAYTPADAEFGY